MQRWWKLLCGAALTATLALAGFAQSQPPVGVSIIGLGVQGVDAVPVAPANERSGPAGTAITVEAEAVGTAMLSSFTYSAYVNGAHIGTSTAPILPPATFKVSWTPPAPGAYFITVEIDDGTSKATSLPIRYFATGTVVNSPVDGTLVPAGSSVVMKADATGAQGFVKQVQFYADGVAIGPPDTTYPYSLIYTPQGAAGTTYHITAVATDNNGVTLPASPSITLTTVTPIPAPPTSVVSTPEDGAVIAVPSLVSPLSVVVDANSSTGFVSKVELYVDGVLLDTKTTFPYRFVWTPQVVGTYRLVALTYDDKNNVVASSVGGGGGATPTPTTITIAAPPTVNLAAPTANSTITGGTPVQISATATDPGGHAITSVQFFVDSEFVGIATVPSSGSTYKITTTLTQKKSSDGTVLPSTITALATNSVGLATISGSVTVNVTAGGGSGGGTVIGLAPTVSLSAPIAAAQLAVGVSHPLIATATDPDGSISSVQFSVNGASLGVDGSYPYSWAWTPTSLGAYAIAATATDNDGNAVTSATVNVSVIDPSAIAPTVAITSPANLASIAVNAPQTILATATDDVAISGVQFYVNGQPQGVLVTAYPYATSWLPASPGTYTLTATAIDNVGNQTTSATNVVTVTATSPVSAVVVITAPASVPTIFVNSTNTVSADAAVANGNIVSVQFFANGALIGNVNSYPYAVSWTPVTPGTYTLTAVATDNHGLETTSPDQVVTVVAGSAPSVTLIAPADGTTVALGGTQNITASANGGSASVAAVQFFLNGNLLGLAPSAPYTIPWTPLTLGTYTLTAAVTDTNGHTVTSAPISATVVVAKPTLEFTPATSVNVNTAQTLVATATPVAGTSITQVEFFINGSSVAVDTVAPYTMPWTPATTGTYTLAAIATDSLGGQSALVSVPVSVVAPPRIDVVSPNAGATYVLGTPTALVANVTVGSGLVVGVSFFVNEVNVTQGGELLAPVAQQGTGSPFFAQNWLPAAAGAYSVVAKVRDTNGNTVISSPVTITVTSGVAPTVAITAPANGAALSVNASVPLTADANSTTGSIDSVQFFANNTPVGAAVRQYPYYVPFTPASPGVYVLTAQATDNLGNVTTSAPHIVTATPTATSIAVTAPANGSSLLINTAQTITASVAAGSIAVSNVEFFVDGISVGVVSQAPYAMSWTPTAAGAHALKAVATDATGNQTWSAAVNVTVSPNQAPTVSITAPLAGATPGVGLPTTVTATAADADGTVAGVQFYVGGEPLGAALTSAPYSLTWTPRAAGSYTLTAVATDNLGAQTTSAGVAVVASGGNAPVVLVSAPANGATVAVNATHTVTAAALAITGTIASVEFFANDVPVGEADTVYPYAVAWTPTALGSYTLKARATDTLGNQSESSITITVASATPNAPSVAITAPAGGSLLAVNSAHTISVSATAATGTIARVEYFANGVSLGASTAFPYSTGWSPSALGAYALTAVATDTFGNEGLSSTVNVTVIDPAASLPTVSITSPTAGTMVGNPTTITATATSPNTIANVQFFANGTPIGTSLTAPYSVVWTPTISGAYNLTAVVTDNLGVYATSVPVPVTLAIGLAPTVSLTSPVDGDTVIPATRQTITAVAADADGTVAKVDFFVDGSLVGTATSAPYSTNWTPTDPGATGYKDSVVTARATDNAGNVTNSAGITVHVSTGPSISVSDATVTPATARPGDQITINVTLSNSGFTNVPTVVDGPGGPTMTLVPTATPANQWDVGGTATFDVTFTQMETGMTFVRSGVTGTLTKAVPGLGGTGTMSVTATVPVATTQAGAYRISVALLSAAGSGVRTTIPRDFASTTSVLTITGRPDLVVTGLTYPAGTAYQGGDVIPMSLIFRNRTATNGVNNVPYVPSLNGDAASFRIEVVLSSNATFGDADDFLLTTFEFGSSIAADNVDHPLTWDQLLPGNFVGSYYVMAKIDTLDGVKENVENDLAQDGNNVWSAGTNGARINLLPSNFPTTYWASPASNGYSDNPALSGSGRYVAFASDATNLVAGDTNAVRDIFLFDSQNSLVRRLNVSQQGAQANGNSNTPAISSDGRYVAFSSEASNLVLGDTNAFSDIFVVDTLTGAITRDSVSSAGAQANGSNFKPALSADGRYLVWESTATNLVTSPQVTPGAPQIYRRDRTTGVTVLVSQSNGGAPGNAASLQAAISGNGQYVAFASDATNLVTGDTNGVRDVFLRDVTAATTIRASVASGGAQANGASRAPAINRNPSVVAGVEADGRYVVFGSEASNLVAGDTNGVSDIFVFDRVAATTTRLSLSTAGAQATDPSPAQLALGSINPGISATGRYVTFASLADNLTAGDFAGRYSATDGNNALDVLVRDRDVAASGTYDTPGNVETSLVSVNRFGYQTVGLLGAASTAASDIYPAISDDGRWVAFPSDAENTGGLAQGATNRTSPDANGSRDVFLHDRRINAIVDSADAPTVALSNPAAASTVVVNRAIPVAAVATASVGVVANVQFFANGTALGVDEDYPYSASWKPVAVGTYNLSALVTDSFGNQAVSPNVTVTVVPNQPPTVTMIDPAGPVSVTTGAPVNLTASVTDPDDTTFSVRFLVDSSAVATVATAPFTGVWTPSAVGSFSVVAEATDEAGNVSVSPAVTITVTANQPPTITLTSPAASGSLAGGMPLELRATAQDVDGTIAGVKFFANNSLIGSVTTAPYVLSWTPSAGGSYVITAQATDDSGNMTPTTGNVTITVVANQSPVVQLTAPADGTTLAEGAATTITAQASDADGSVTNVKFYVNGTLLAIGAAAPYSTPWIPSSAGLYRLTAVATDNAGSTAASAAVNIMVVSPGSTAPDVVYKGIYGSAEQGTFMMINIGGKRAALIGQSGTGAVKTYFLPSLALNGTGVFSETIGGHTFAGQASDGAVSATLGGPTGLVFIGPATSAMGSAVASGYYTGNLTGAAASQVAAIVAPDGSIEVYVANGTFTDAGAGTVDATGAFRVTTAAGNTLTGIADPATGFLTGTLTGGPGGSFTGAIASGSSLSDGALLNVSTRGLASTGDRVLIAGFVVEGSTPKRMLVRAAGPSLNLPGQVANPTVALFDGTGATVATNDDWGVPVGVGAASQADIAAAAAQVGAFAFTKPTDSAVLATLNPGSYTAQVSSGAGAAGIALVEVYDVDTPASFSAQKVVNLSTRGQVGSGADEGLIAGFVISGHAAKKVLIRGAGPWLANFSVAGLLANPRISLSRINLSGPPTLVRENDDWAVGNDPALVADATLSAGATPFADDSKDAAILLRLPPGVYTATLTGVGGSTGIALIEVYEVP